MQRRGESGQPAKEQRTTRPKARKAPTAHVSNAALQEELGRAMRERDEALEQLAATSGVLQVISSMPGDRSRLRRSKACVRGTAACLDGAKSTCLRKRTVAL